jgi:hypothetical protein
VGLGVRPHPHLARHGLLERLQVALEGVEVENQRRGVDLFEALTDRGRRSLAHAAALSVPLTKREPDERRRTSAISGSAMRLTRSQPALVTVIPDVNEEITIMMKIVWSLAPCALARSSGR